MEMSRNYLKHHTKFLVIIVLMAFACASPKRRSDQGEPYPAGPKDHPELMGPEAPATAEVYGPEPVENRAPTLVLSAGQARAFSQVGVLKAFHEMRVPVGAILASGTGALIGALYATSDSIHQFEWKLQKFNTDLFVDQESKLKRFFSSSRVDRLRKAVEEAFLNQEIQETRVPFQIVFAHPTGSSLLRDQVLQALREDEVLESDNSGALPIYPVDQAKSFRTAKIIVVDMGNISDGKYDLGSLSEQQRDYLIKFKRAIKESTAEMARADFIIAPKLEGVSIFDFQKRSDLVFRGRKESLVQKSKLQSILKINDAKP